MSTVAGNASPQAGRDESERDGDFYCSVQPHLPAAAFCTVCRRPYSGRYLGVRPDGRAICFRCARDQRIDFADVTPRGEGDPALRGSLFQKLGAILLRAHLTLNQRYEGSIVPALRFGYLTTLAGLVFYLSWQFLLAPEAIDAVLEGVIEQTGGATSMRAARLSLWAVMPVVAAVRMVAGIFALHLGLRLAGADGSLRDHARIFALTSSALVLCALPLFVGSLLAEVMWVMATMAWIRTRYDFTTLRTIGAILPALIVVVLLAP